MPLGAEGGSSRFDCSVPEFGSGTLFPSSFTIREYASAQDE
jgi:hypothetical protein